MLLSYNIATHGSPACTSTCEKRCRQHAMGQLYRWPMLACTPRGARADSFAAHQRWKLLLLGPPCTASRPLATRAPACQAPQPLFGSLAVTNSPWVPQGQALWAHDAHVREPQPQLRPTVLWAAPTCRQRSHVAVWLVPLAPPYRPLAEQVSVMEAGLERLKGAHHQPCSGYAGRRL